MRLFVAVRVNDSVLNTAAAAAREIQQRLGSRVAARWVSEGNMHLTVRFIGEVEDVRVDSVLAALQPPLPIARFDAALGPCGVFPRTGPPRVIWLGLSEGVTSLQAMHDEFDRRLLPCGLDPEDRPFSGHLTLARLKDSQRSPRLFGGRSMARSSSGVTCPRAERHISRCCRSPAPADLTSRLPPPAPRLPPRV